MLSINCSDVIDTNGGSEYEIYKGRKLPILRESFKLGPISVPKDFVDFISRGLPSFKRLVRQTPEVVRTELYVEEGIEGLIEVSKAKQRLYHRVIDDFDLIQAGFSEKEREIVYLFRKQMELVAMQGADIPLHSIDTAIYAYCVFSHLRKNGLIKKVSPSREDAEIAANIIYSREGLGDVVRETMGPEEFKNLYLRVRNSETTPLEMAFYGFLHDVGKMDADLNQELLVKIDPLTEEEKEELRYHAAYSFRNLVSIDPKAAMFALLHHEKWNLGSADYFGLSGNLIPVESQILVWADIFSARLEGRKGRPYKIPLPKGLVLKEMEKDSGKLFNPYYFDIARNMADSYPLCSQMRERSIEEPELFMATHSFDVSNLSLLGEYMLQEFNKTMYRLSEVLGPQMINFTKIWGNKLLRHPLGTLNAQHFE